MNPQLSLVVLAATPLLSFFPAAPDAGRLVVQPPSCKPSAPIEIEVLDASVANGVAFVRYQVESRLEAGRVESTVELVDGGVLLNDRGIRAIDVVPGARHVGSARVRLPSGATGARLTVRAAMTFTASGGELDGQDETVVETRTVTWGTVESTPALPVVVSDGVATLDVPAVRTGGENR